MNSTTSPLNLLCMESIPFSWKGRDFQQVENVYKRLCIWTKFLMKLPKMIFSQKYFAFLMLHPEYHPFNFKEAFSKRDTHSNPKTKAIFNYT